MTNVLDPAGRLQVLTGDKPPTSAIAQSPFPIPPSTAGGVAGDTYSELLATAEAIAPHNAGYLEGWLIAWTLLQGVTVLDLAATKARLLAARAAGSKNKSNFGQGVTDVHRLLNEPQYGRDVWLVIQNQ
jgi:hypothetical protein